MKLTQYILILLSLFLISNCGEKVRIEITERYDNGNKRLLVKYRGEGGDEVVVERINYRENGDTITLEKPLDKMIMVREYDKNRQIVKEENYRDGERDGKRIRYWGNGRIWIEENEHLIKCISKILSIA